MPTFCMSIEPQHFHMHKFLVLPFTFLLLCACTEKNLPSDNPQSDTTPKGKVMRLHAEFSMGDHFSFIAKPSSRGTGEREQLIKGSFDQIVEVDMQDDGKSFTFRPINGKPATVVSTITEKGHSSAEDPESPILIQSTSHANFSGTIMNNLDFKIKRSEMGQGDEITMKMEGELTGEAQSIATLPDHSKTTTDEAGMWDSILEKVNPPDPHRRHYSKTWIIVPTLGTRPGNEPVAQMLYDAIIAAPSMFHQGLVTSPNRQQWHYKGTLVRADTDKPTEAMKWLETLELTLRLDPP